MRVNKKIEVKIEECKCDFCNCSSDKNYRRAGGFATIETCYVCKKDVCKEHRYLFLEKCYATNEDYDNLNYYNEIITCLECKDMVGKIWEKEKEMLERGGHQGELVYRVIRAIKETGKWNEK